MFRTKFIVFKESFKITSKFDEEMQFTRVAKWWVAGIIGKKLIARVLPLI